MEAVSSANLKWYDKYFDTERIRFNSHSYLQEHRRIKWQGLEDLPNARSVQKIMMGKIAKNLEQARIRFSEGES
jgi:hypothetical protein